MAMEDSCWGVGWTISPLLLPCKGTQRCISSLEARWNDPRRRGGEDPSAAALPGVCEVVVIPWRYIGGTFAGRLCVRATVVAGGGGLGGVCRSACAGSPAGQPRDAPCRLGPPHALASPFPGTMLCSLVRTVALLASSASSGCGRCCQSVGPSLKSDVCPSTQNTLALRY